MKGFELLKFESVQKWIDSLDHMAIQRGLFGLVEKETDSGRVLEDRAWCFQFEKKPTQGGAPITIDWKFFSQLDSYTNPHYVSI